MDALETSLRRILAALKTADTTRYLYMDAGLISHIPDLFKQSFGDQPAVIIADINTYKAAGRAVQEQLHSSPIPVLDPFIFDELDFYAEYRHVQRLQSFLSANQAIPIAVGSGTINDLTKLAAFLCQRQYLAFATAASMDGYTAFGASISQEGFKQTFFCPAPKAVVVDLEVIAAAPAEMNAAGYGDLLAKIPAGADWLVADALGLDIIDKAAWHMVQEPLRSWLADPCGVRQASMPALTGLMEGLLMSGLAMQKTQSSRTASGAEHQFSHLWDNQHLRHHGSIPFHGFKVAIGSLAVTALYQMLLRMSADNFRQTPNRVAEYWPKWQDIEKVIVRDFPDLKIASMVLQESRAKYQTAPEISERLERLADAWPALRARLQEQLCPAAELRRWLKQAGAPTRPEEIGLSPARLKSSYRQAQLIRRRYTALDLALESGLWAPALDALFAQNGFWQG
ncbi:MAG TPA: sn-glycerol-1-phosphate dehydrogenase [bacterium]|nr:sn-glycerol-1-phosphate dehydrogenase [bacterium]